MNTRQRRILLVGLFVVALMALFPPWCQGIAIDSYRFSVGYGFIASPPHRAMLDVARIAVQFVAVAALCGALMLAAGGRGKE